MPIDPAIWLSMNRPCVQDFSPGGFTADWRKKTFEYFKYPYPMAIQDTPPAFTKQSPKRFMVGTLVYHKEDKSGERLIMIVEASVGMPGKFSDPDYEYYIHRCSYQEKEYRHEGHFKGEDLVEYKFVSPSALLHIWKTQPLQIGIVEVIWSELASMGLIETTAAGLVVTPAGNKVIDDLIQRIELEELQQYNKYTGIMSRNGCPADFEIPVDKDGIWGKRENGDTWSPDKKT